MVIGQTFVKMDTYCDIHRNKNINQENTCWHAHTVLFACTKGSHVHTHTQTPTRSPLAVGVVVPRLLLQPWSSEKGADVPLIDFFSLFIRFFGGVCPFLRLVWELMPLWAWLPIEIGSRITTAKKMLSCDFSYWALYVMFILKRWKHLAVRYSDFSLSPN